jgi:hypothetical protein
MLPEARLAAPRDFFLGWGGAVQATVSRSGRRVEPCNDSVRSASVTDIAEIGRDRRRVSGFLRLCWVSAAS